MDEELEAEAEPAEEGKTSEGECDGNKREVEVGTNVPPLLRPPLPLIPAPMLPLLLLVLASIE